MRGIVISLVACLGFSACDKSGYGANRENKQAASAIASHERQGSVIVRGISFELNANKVYLPVYVNHEGPYWFILDTGSVTNVVDKRAAKALHLPLQGSSTARGVGEDAVKSTHARHIYLKLSNLELNVPTVEVLPLNAMLSATEGHEVDGLLGYSFLSRYVVEIDYLERTISLYDPRTYSYKGPGEIIPLEIIRKNPHVSAKVSITKDYRVQGRFLVDTGSRSAITFTTPFVDDNDLLSHVAKTVADSGNGIGGESRTVLGRVHSLQIQDLSFNEVPVEFAQATAGVLSDRGFDGIIGGEILRRFKVIVNYSKSQLVLEPNKEFSQPINGDMSGLWIIAEGKGLRSFRVRHVIADSPAAEAGLHEGDVIEAVDGRNTADLTLEQLLHLFRGGKGEIHILQVRRKDKSIRVDIKLRQLI